MSMNELTVFCFPNGNVACCDTNGKQVVKYQRGYWPEMRDLLIADGYVLSQLEEGKYRAVLRQSPPAPSTMSECNCHLSHPSYAGFIGNHSPMCPANRDPKYSCVTDLLKQLTPQSPPAPENEKYLDVTDNVAKRFSEKNIQNFLGYHFNKDERHEALNKAKWIILQLQRDLEELKAAAEQAAELLWDRKIPYEYGGRPVEEASAILNDAIQKLGAK